MMFEDLMPPVMRGASAGTAGAKGLAPKPAAGQQSFYLRGDGTYANGASGSFLGGIAGASVPATASAAGDWYYVISVGTSQSKTWAIGDKAVYNGSSGSWTQIAAQALLAYNAPTAISAAGNTNLALGTGQALRVEKISVSAGSAAFTHTLTLQNTNAVAGYEIKGQISVAASAYPLIELRNLTSGGTLLGAIPGESRARVWNFCARFDGTNWFLTEFAKQRAASIDELHAFAHSRNPRPQLAFDGTAALACAIPALGTKWTVAFTIKVADVATQTLFYLGASSHIVGMRNTGALFASQGGTGREFTDAILTAKQLHHVVLVCTDGYTTPYIDGVPRTPVADANDYNTITQWGYAGTPAYRLGAPRVYNRALSAEEVRELYESGEAAAADFNTASATSLITGSDSTFAADTGFWTKAGSATIDAANNNVCTLLSGGASYISRNALLTLGKKYRVTITASSGNTGLLIYFGSGNPLAVTYAATMTLEGVVTTDTQFLVVNSSGSASAVLTSISVIPLGVVCAPEAAAPGAGPQWRDVSGNSAHLSLPGDGVTGGVQWSLPGANAADFGETKTASGYALGRDAVVIPPGYRIARIWCSGNGTFSIGNAAAGTEIVNAFTATATTQPATLAAYVTSSLKLYLTLGTATTVTYTVQLERI